ncbi:MAG: AAA family ATPase [Lachnospiraceae bacterium]|nr:AAA family ATPase [Lachnospiraceae bacterium]
MKRTVAIGIQDFSKIREGNYFYIDKTSFIKEWWESGDDVTLITRPRRFGKTLNMNMVETFFSAEYAGRGDLFEGLSIWEEEKYRKLQGTWPVISLSFAGIKEPTYEKTLYRIRQILMKLYEKHFYLREKDVLSKEETVYFEQMMYHMNEMDAPMALYQLSDYLQRYYGKKVIILLDEYDTPMQEAYANGYWEELVAFTRSLFNSTFKTNPYLHRGLMTGITRVSRESIFSDLNHLNVVTTTSNEYASCFGFTQEEVLAALEEFGVREEEEKVRFWYDGFTFGKITDIYNPWSILNYLDKKVFSAYWANSSANTLVSNLLKGANPDIKSEFEELLRGNALHKTIDEQIVYDQLGQDESAIWSLLVAAGYLKLENVVIYGYTECDILLTNEEVKLMFRNMVSGWFRKHQYEYNSFIKALLKGDKKAMNAYMNKIALATISYFDAGSHPSQAEPERFYHGFVLGLMVDLRDRYVITSNRESGFGRYDIMLTPLNDQDDAMIIEFKVYDAEDEKSLQDTVESALKQIKDMHYEEELLTRGIPTERIRKYGFAFEGKRVLIG